VHVLRVYCSEKTRNDKNNLVVNSIDVLQSLAMQTHPERDAETTNTQVSERTEIREAAKTNPTFLAEFIKFAIIAIIVVFPIRIFVAQPFIVSGASMDPTFAHGEYLIVDELSYRFRNPERGEVIIFRYPEDTSKFFIKRVIGLPGESIVMRNGNIRITSDEYPDGADLDQSYLERISTDAFTVTLKDEEYFVLGDNRTASSDSRVWGPLSREFIIGRAFLRLLPITHASTLPGDYELIIE